MPSPQKLLFVRFTAPQLQKLHKLPMNQLDAGCMGGFRKQEDGTYAIDAVRGLAAQPITSCGRRS
jgi:hypothetical protein